MADKKTKVVPLTNKDLKRIKADVIDAFWEHPILGTHRLMVVVDDVDVSSKPHRTGETLTLKLRLSTFGEISKSGVPAKTPRTK